MKTSIRKIAILHGVSLCLMACGLDAQVSVSETTSQTGNTYVYDYSVHNIGSTAIAAFNVDSGAAPISTEAPTGWVTHVLPISYRRIVQWVALDSSAYIQPGASLAGFSIESESSPGEVAAGTIDQNLNIFDDSTTQGPAFLSSQFLNISTRLQAEAGDNVLIGGFIVTGSQTKTVLIRGIGPSLGLPGALPNPLLELYDSSGRLLASDDNWGDFQDQQPIIDSTISPTDKDEAAIWKQLPPGAYTTILRDANGGSGVGLVEVYDLDEGTDSKLANISTRGLVQTGDDVMIGGIIIGGSASSDVLVRAIGPSLTLQGVPGALADPTLELHDSNGVIITSNDDWKDSQQSAIEATSIAPTDDAESAILATLGAGAYTAIVRGKTNATGVALVEAYQLDN